MRRVAATALSAVLLLAHLFAAPAAAEQVQVTAGVGDTTIRITGWTAPFAFVTLMESSVVVGTATAGSDGRYVLLLLGQTPGIHNFRVFSRDQDGRITEAVMTQLNAAEHSETAATVFLPPAVNTKDDGGSVIIEGSTVPGATVVITVGGKHFTTTADTAGNWRYVIAAGDLPASEYHISVAAILPGGLQSHIAGIPSVSIPPAGYVAPRPGAAARPGAFWIGTTMVPAPEAVTRGMGEESGNSQITSLSPGREWAEKTAAPGQNGNSLLLLGLLWLLVLGAFWWLLARRRARPEGDDT